MNNPTTYTGSLVRWDDYGLGYVEATGKQFPFTFDKVAGYQGESPKQLGWRIGCPVQFTTCDGLTIKELTINNDAIKAGAQS